ncbi:hypothetical protein FEM48_Zijuj10G0162700 [Ziziphus jujuba var. spinosa]|uniref:Pentatricopeptide repeat-containing protein At5g13770, chloroplastic n=1 Tax=Ziziphus jujuba var. spinosa TaxID=714518 RepID=A0A978UPE6_ZIZJJ|nr:hypothetical protein FEM48_Zijuj10G0162700 [Ziziphus jujuba var. spinosa]
MAIFSSSDWSFACTKPSHMIASSIPPCKTLSFFHISSSNLRFSHLNSTGCSSPTLEETSPNFPLIELDLNIRSSSPSQQYPVPDSDHDMSDFLCGLFRDPRTEEFGYDYYEKAKENPEFRPKKSTLKHLIRYLIRSKKWGLVLSVCDDFREYNVMPDGYTFSKLISSCIRARKFRIVETLLGELKYDCEVAVLAFDSAMRGYNELHMFRSTVSAFERMNSAGIVLNCACYCRIMEAYMKLEDFEQVIKLFNQFQTKQLDFTPFSTQIYEILCQSLCKSGRNFEALEIFRNKKIKGVLGDTSNIYSSLISSFASSRKVKLVEELFREAEKEGMLKDPTMFPKLISMYVEEGSVEKTLEIVKAMKNAKLTVSDCICCAVVNGFSKIKGFRAAVKVYEDLLLQGCEPGQVTYASIINIYCSLGLYSKAETIFSEMEQKGFEKCVVAYCSMVVMYGKTGRIREAMRIVAKMKERGCEPNVWIYNALLDMHGRAKNLRQVEKLWKEMKRRKVAPDKVSYTSVISAYNKARDFENCMKFYHEYRINGGMIDKVMAGIMVGVFSKTGRVDDLVKLLRDLRLEGAPLDARLYKSAMNALRDAGIQIQDKWLQDSFEAT